MGARNSVKAVIVRDGALLLNRCRSRFGEYYALPGGGQRTGELLEEALVREILEETGYRVQPIRMAAVFERISELRIAGAKHKVYFVFHCELEPGTPVAPTEPDQYQLDCKWVPVSNLTELNLFPKGIRDHLPLLVEPKGETLFIGSVRGK